MSPLTPNLRLHDRYVLHDRIGLGGMSEVWRADDDVLGRPVAVKVLAGTFAVDPDLRAAIRREARAAARLAHPHVTQVYDYGEATLDGGTVPYLVMELVDGRNLADRLSEGPLPWPSALRTAAEVAAALAAAHRIGVVHRDIKPGNVMLTETGAKVLDFGIAALAGPQSAGTSSEPMMGTPAYTAPERLRAGAPNPASDVYALGVLLHRTLTGDVPLPVRSWEEAVLVHARRPPVPPPRVPGLPTGVAELVRACLDPDPARRPGAGEVAARLRAATADTAGPFTAMLPISAPADPADATASRSASAQPPTLVDRAGTWPGTDVAATALDPATAPGGSTFAGPGSARATTRPWSASAPVAAEPARPWSASAPVAAGPARAGRGVGRQRRRYAPPTGALVAAGLALLVGLGVVLARGNGDGASSPGGTAGSAPAAAAAAPTSASPAAPRPSPSTADPEPVSLRQAAAEFVTLLAEAQLVGDIDRKAAERLRKDLTDLARGKPKDQEKRIEKLRDRIEDEVEDGRLPADFADRLDDLLDRLEAALPEED
ncbi:protein kinase [Micromonospora sp. FIMYZ51]|uniref:serine/threonine-protein kinase n=1 Tax=Micromonospora sp. FIMYZ51 TaxID=3051832 RepID=UPI00311D4471